jgi:uncharacterized protein YfaP (DUF2135 family)
MRFLIGAHIVQAPQYSRNALEQELRRPAKHLSWFGTVSKKIRYSIGIVCTATLFGCGGGGSSSSPPPPPTQQNFSLGGVVTNLAPGASLQLASGGPGEVTLSANGTFKFPVVQPTSTSYTVTVKTQPAGQFCNVANGTGTIGAADVTNVGVTCAKILAGGTATLSASGGTVKTDAADVTAPSGASLQDQTVTVASMPPPSGIPTGYTPVGAAVNVEIDKADVLNAPFLVTLRYDAGATPDEDKLAVLHYNPSTNAYEPLTILNQDKSLHSIQFEARSFSPFLVVSTHLASVPAAFTVANFTPATKGWAIPNFGSYYSPGGNCLGMAGYATWFFGSRTENLHGKFSSTGSPNVAQLVAARAMLAQSQYWAKKSSTYLNTLGKPATAALMKAYLALSGKPLILLMGTDGAPQHAGVVYGYDQTGFIFYDTNVPDQQQRVSFDGTTWGTYAGYNYFSFVAVPSLGRTEDFAQLTTEAEAGFTTSSLIQLTSPTPGQQITTHNVTLTGVLSGSLNSGASLIAYVKGVPQLVSPRAGEFSATLPVSSGSNTIVLFAGVNISAQSNWYKNAATLVLDVSGTFTPATLLTTLTWNQDQSDVDLYVTEPPPDGSTAWYRSMTTPRRLTLDFDNTDGYGPEHTTLTTTGANPGSVLPGNYPIMVHYYSDKGTQKTVTGTVTIVVNEGQPNQKVASKAFTIATSNSSNALPGSTGADWVQIGTVDLVAGTISLNP